MLYVYYLHGLHIFLKSSVIHIIWNNTKTKNVLNGEVYNAGASLEEKYKFLNKEKKNFF